MRLKKTNATNRTTYTYSFTEMGENGEYITRTETLRPGENGVTEMDIKMLHSLDDSEVYNNLKNLRPKVTDDEKSEQAAWLARYKSDFLIKFGYEPTADDIRYAISERYPKKWALSLNQFESDEDQTDTVDKHCDLIDPTALVDPDDTLSAKDLRVREILITCTAKQQEAVRLVYVEGFTQEKAAQIAGCSQSAIKQRLDCVFEKIRESF